MNTVAAIPATTTRLVLDEQARDDRALIYSSSRAFVFSGEQLNAVVESRDPGLKSIQEEIAGLVASTERHRDIVMLARKYTGNTEDVQVDNSASVAEGDDNGACVQAWVWIPFEGTPLDKASAEAEVAHSG